MVFSLVQYHDCLVPDAQGEGKREGFDVKPCVQLSQKNDSIKKKSLNIVGWVKEK